MDQRQDQHRVSTMSRMRRMGPISPGRPLQPQGLKSGSREQDEAPWGAHERRPQRTTRWWSSFGSTVCARAPLPASAHRAHDENQPHRSRVIVRSARAEDRKKSELGAATGACGLTLSRENRRAKATMPPPDETRAQLSAELFFAAPNNPAKMIQGIFGVYADHEVGRLANGAWVDMIEAGVVTKGSITAQLVRCTLPEYFEMQARTLAGNGQSDSSQELLSRGLFKAIPWDHVQLREIGGETHEERLLGHVLACIQAKEWDFEGL
jgi:hypothetical protein